MARFTDLTAKAATVGIDLAPFEALHKQFGEVVATKALDTAIKEKEKALEAVDHVALFLEAHGPEVEELWEAIESIKALVDVYNGANNSKLNLDLEAEERGDLIAERRRGQRTYIERDAAAFVKRLKGAGYTTQIRIKDARDGLYHQAALTDTGGVKMGDTTYDTLNEWASAIFQKAVEEGRRRTVQVNAWVSTEIQQKDGTYARLNDVYDSVMVV